MSIQHKQGMRKRRMRFNEGVELLHGKYLSAIVKRWEYMEGGRNMHPFTPISATPGWRMAKAKFKTTKAIIWGDD